MRKWLGKPWDWAGIGIILFGLGMLLSESIGFWRWFEYAAMACGLVAVWLEHKDE